MDDVLRTSTTVTAVVLKTEPEPTTDELTFEPEEAFDVVLRGSVAPRSRPASVPPPPPPAALRTSSPVGWTASPPGVRPRVSTVPGLVAPPTTDDTHAQLAAVRAQLDRTARQMRARDAYLAELERALQTNTRPSGGNTRDRNAELLGRVRGQAFRIAELEAELRQAVVALAAQRASANGSGAPSVDDLKLIRGVGPRFERQLRGMGVVSFQSVAAWNTADIQRIAEQLRIRPERIERDAWVDQARALSAKDGGPLSSSNG